MKTSTQSALITDPMVPSFNVDCLMLRYAIGGGKKHGYPPTEEDLLEEASLLMEQVALPQS